MNRLNLIILSLYCLFFAACSNDVEKIYSNRTEILRLFNGVTVIRRGDLLHFEFKKDSLTNVFIFKETRSSNLTFIRDSIQFELSFLENYGLQKWSNKREFELELQKRVHFLLDVMGKYDIKGITNEFSQFGIVFYIYLPQKIMLYVPALDAVKGANKIDENWYWREYEHE
jgi:hypothetical protein